MHQNIPYALFMLSAFCRQCVSSLISRVLIYQDAICSIPLILSSPILKMRHLKVNVTFKFWT